MSETRTSSSSAHARSRFRRRSNDTLGIAWLHGEFHAAVFRRQSLVRAWTCSETVDTLPAFEAAFDAATAAVDFSGVEVFLILAHEQFVHQPEQAPPFSEAAARSYLRGRVERFEKEHGPVLWVSQRMASVRQDAAYLLHMLPAAFYDGINSLLLARRFDLTRVLPASVPLQLVLESGGVAKGQPVLLAAATGSTTAVLAAKADAEALFSRNLQAGWDRDPARLGVELNRSLLYAKQQFGVAMNRVCLLGAADAATRAELQARCGEDRTIDVVASSPTDWLHAVARLSARHPVNLVAGYLGRKRRNQLIRRSLIAACWLGIAVLGLDAWATTLRTQEARMRLEELGANQAAMYQRRAELIARNQTMDTQRRFIAQVDEERVPSVPGKLLAYVASVIPQTVALTEFQCRHDPATARWRFRLEGRVDGDEETAHDLLTSLQRQLTRSVFQARFDDTARVIVPVSIAADALPDSQRFAVEGGLFEN